MAILAIDTTMGSCSAALGWAADGGSEQIVSLLELRTRGHAERIVPMIGELMVKAGAGFSEIRGLAVTAGPGSFTGVRAGLAAAKGLALATGIRLQGTSSTHVMARELRHWRAENGPQIGARTQMIIACDARRDEVYCQLFDAEAVPLSPPQVCTATQAVRDLTAQRVIIAGSAADAVLDAARAVGLDAKTEARPTQPDARWLVQLSLEGALPDGPPVPIYLRKPDAKSQAGASLPRR